MSEQGAPVAAPESPEVVGARARARVAAMQGACAEVPPCDPEPDPEECYAPPYYDPAVFAQPWRPEQIAWYGPATPSHDVAQAVDRPALLGDLARLMAAVRAGVAPGSAVESKAAPPELPELVPGADAAGRRAQLDRLGALLREVRAGLDGQPADVVARAKRALGWGS
jgi:hypothetical protein